MSLIHPVIFTDQHSPSHVLRILPAFWVAENIGEQGYIVSLEQLWLLWACIKPLFTNAMRPQCACNCDIIMAYGSMPYVGMAPKNNGGHFKISGITWVLPWATGTLPSLESTRPVSCQNRQIIYLLTSRHTSTIMVETITPIQTWKKDTNHWVLHSLFIVITRTILQ